MKLFFFYFFSIKNKFKQNELLINKNIFTFVNKYSIPKQYIQI